MKWLWSCFSGKTKRLRQKDADAAKTRGRSGENLKAQGSPTNLHSLGAQIKSPLEVLAYDEPFQPKQVVSSSPHGSKLFKRKSVRRAKSCGSSTAFENGAKRLFDKYAVGHIDKLQEEVEGLRKRLAQEEEEARKLRHEVSYLRSCGVLQSPDRQRKEGSIERDTLLPREEKSQPNSPTWLGLTLSPTSRFKLEEQLRFLAADEMSKVPSRGLTNGQKALIVATKLWRNQGHPHQDNHIVEAVSSGVSDEQVSHSNVSLENQLTSEDFDKRRFGQQLMNQDPSFREQLQFGKFSNISEPSESGSPGSTVTEMENFSFHPSTIGDKVDARQFDAEILSVKDGMQLPRAPSCPEPIISCLSSFNYLSEGADESSPRSATERVKFEYPRKLGSQPTVSSGSQSADSDHVQARRFIDLRYQELEEKLLRSPKSESLSCRQTPENAIPDEEDSSAEQDASDVSEETDRSDVQDVSYNSASPSSLGGKTYFAGKSGRLWRPLSPVRESDSGRSSREDLAVSSASHFHVSDSADSSSASDLKSSLRTIISASKWEQKENFSHHGNNSDSHDDDLFTLSPRRLHHDYDSWYNGHRSDDEIDNEHKMVDTEVNSGTGASWASGDEADSEDIAPIQCQSPAFSPKQKFRKNKLVDGKALKVEDYQRDKYFKEMGFNVDEFLLQSRGSGESTSSGKDSQDEVNSLSAGGDLEENGQSTTTQPVTLMKPISEGQTLKKSLGANDSQDWDHPVLSSIENLPKLMESQNAGDTPLSKDTQHDRIHMLELGKQATGVEGRQESNPVLSPSEFSITKKAHNSAISQSSTNLDERLSMSLHGFVYEENEQDVGFPVAEEHSIPTRRLRNSMGVATVEQMQGGMRSETGSSLISCTATDHQDEGSADSTNVEHGGGQFQVSPNRQSSTGAHQKVERLVRLDNNVRNDVLSHAQSLGYTIRIPKFKDSFSDTELAFESSSFDGDSELSRDGDETFHDCESPTLSEASSEPSQSGSLQSEPNHQYFRNSKVRATRDDAVPAKKTIDISPDDRPILGTVATHWGDTSNPKPQREWDGLGIPNSTSKFKEDQRVSWHTTPFETRLEQALAKLPIVPELNNQRRLFEGVAMS